ncbi:MAG: glycogen debranching enzyme N-terminal domain-containing protein [Bacteroidetes bacterium]|nr:glycogen debranching enzyme N-terminal domain-containing protein [Bacteroidota bacterium]
MDLQIVFDSSITKNYDVAKSREWLIANGLGSYASSTIIGLNARGYHGLLVAALEPPGKRVLFLSKLEEEIEVGGKKYLLAVNSYPGAVYPQGHLHLEQFRFERYPIFVYKVGNAILEKTVFMPYGDNTTIVTYRLLEADSPVKLTVYPIVNHRDFHGRTHQDPHWNFAQTMNTKGVEIRAFHGATTLYLQSDIAQYTTTGFWYKNFTYETSAARGHEGTEDQYNPGYFSAKIEQGSQISILASLRPQPTFSTEGMRFREMQRIRGLTDRLPRADSFFETLASIADTFLVKRKSTNMKTVIAGYHWFADWGRDSMISIPGLTLVTKREEEGKEIVRTFLHYAKDGLIPNTLPDGSAEPDYHSVDASLWLIYACHAIYSETGSLDFVSMLYPKLQETIASYAKGTRYGIRMEEDGLVTGGDESTSLTWMDAGIDGTPVTPRFGKPVEISALWYNALRSMERFAYDLDKESDAHSYQLISEKVKTSFNEKFWDDERKCLHDVLVDDVGDSRTRPNQILSLSLPYPVLEESRWRDVLRVVEAELLTPVGLRSLSPLDPEYKGTYNGTLKERNLAYHQGSAWPWLLGPFVTAYVRVFSGDPKTLSFVRQLYTPFIKRMQEAGIGSISEIYDGEPPNTARGCISQAWSVAELLRSYARDANQF